MTLTKEQKNNIVWDMVIEGVFSVEDGQVYRLKDIISKTGVYIPCKRVLKSRKTIIRYEKYKSFNYIISHIAVLCYGGQPVQENELVHHQDEDYNNNRKSNLFVGEKGGKDGHAAYHMIGKKHSEETKRKISKGNKGLKASEETKKKISEAGKGKHHSEETKRKMSESHKGNKNMLGKHHSEEAKKKISESTKGEKSYLFGKFGKDHNTSKAVEMLDFETMEVIREFGSGREAQRITGIHNGSISECCNKHKNYSYAGKYNDRKVTWRHKK